MKKKLLACILATLMCLQPASAVLAENAVPDDLAQSVDEFSGSSDDELSDTALPDTRSSDDSDIVAVPDPSASDTSENISDADSDVDSADSDLSEENSAQELTEDFSDDAETLEQEESDSIQEVSPESDFNDGSDDGSISSAGTESTSDGFQYKTSGLTATITKYTGTASIVTVPSTIGKYTVTQIDYSAFSGNLNITDVIISDTVTSIGSWAFSGCAALKTIKLPSGLKSLGHSFISGTRITTLTIPASLTSCQCYNTYNSDTSYGALHGAENLTELILEDGMEKVPAYLAWFSTSETTNLSSISIPDSITSIGNYAFANCTKLSKLSLPDSVTSISGDAFSGCKSLSSIHWSEKLQTIKDSAFKDCTAIERLSFPKSVENIGSYAFSGCNSVSSLSFTDNPKGGFLVKIQNSAFRNCTALENISFSKNINSLGASAFSGCSSLSSVVLNDSTATIDSYAFSDCSALESIKLPSKLKELGHSFISGTLVTTLTIPASLTSCQCYNTYNSDTSYGALHGAENLTELILEDGMEKVPAYLAWFSTSETTNLSSISIPDSVTSIGNYAFANCTKLPELSLPDSVTSISGDAFSGCKNLSSIHWSEKLQTIEDRAFKDCTAIERLSFPKSLENIGNYAFSGCNSVSSLSFADNPKGGFLVKIQASAFRNCTALENISFSKNINFLGSSAFSGCSSLSSVILSDSITTVDSYAFSGCSALESLKLPSKLKELGHSFISGTLVTTLTIPASLTSCQCYNTYNSDTSYGALHGAENLTELILEDGMEKVPAYLAWFSTSETTNLTSISIPDSVTSIGGYAFANCTKLGEITIPDSVTSIADTAFQGWKNLSIRSVAGSAAHAYAKANNIPFHEIIKECELIIAGRLDGVNAEEGTINLEGRDYPVADNFSLTSAMNILKNSRDRIVIFNYDNSRVTHMEAAENIIEVYMDLTIPFSSPHFIYENGQYQESSISRQISLKCRVSEKSAYKYAEIRQLLPNYTVPVTGIQITADSPLNVHFQESLIFSEMAFQTPVNVKFSSSQTIATAVFKLSDDYTPEKVKSSFHASFLVRYGDSASYVHAGGTYAYLENRDYQRQKTEQKKAKTERGQKIASARQLLDKNNSILTIDPKLNDYFTKPQMEEFYDFLSGYVAVLINSTSFSYTGDQKNSASKQVLEKLFEKMGITKDSFVLGKTMKGSFSISASTKKGDRTINFTYSVTSYGWSDINFSSLGTLDYSISQDNCSGMIGLAGADTKAFAEQVKALAESAVKNTYNEAWGKHADEVADILFTKTIQDIIRNSRFGSFSNLVYTMLTKPSQVAAKNPRTRTNIHCPVDVYVYDSSHNLCGSIINNVIDTSYNDIFMTVNGDEKFISFCGDDYYLKLVGNDTGSMTYEVEEYDGDTLSRKITYNDIPLTAGKTYNTYVPENQDMDTGIYSPVDESGEKSEAASDTRKTAPEHIYVKNIQLDQTQKSLLVGESFSLTPDIQPENASVKDVLWSSDNESIAAVDNNGTVKALSAGTAVITAQTFDGALTATCTVTVTSPEISVDTLTITVPDVDCNGEAQLPQVTVKDGDTLLTPDKDYTLSYSDNISPGTATVTVTGLGTYTGTRSITFQILEKSHNWSSWKITRAATALKAGQKQHTCSYCGKTETAAVARLKPTIKLSMTSVVLKKGQTTTAFKVTGLAKGDKVKSYSSASKKIASIDSRGKIKGLRVGSTKITVTLASGKKATVKVKVQKNAVATQKLSVSPSRISLKLKKTYKLKISRTPLTTVEKITYRSSNAKIASVNSKGVITARKKGTATITILSGKKKSTVKVTVK